MKFKKYVHYLKYPLMILLVWYLAKSGKFDYKSFGTFFSGLKILYFPVMLFFLLIIHLLFARRYQLFINSLGYFASFRDIFNIIMVGVFYNNFFPGGTGGDLIRIYYLKSKHRLPIAVGTSATLLDRVVGMLGLVFVASASFALLTFYVEVSFLNEHRMIFIISLLFPIIAVALLLSLRINFIFNLFVRIVSILPLRDHLLSFLSTSHILTSNTRLIFISLGLCSVGHIMTLLSISFIAYTLFGLDAAIASAAVSGVVLLSSVVPITPGNIGLTELLADKLFISMGVSGGATVFVIWRLLTVVFSIFGGLIYLCMGGRKDPDLGEAVLLMEVDEKSI